MPTLLCRRIHVTPPQFAADQPTKLRRSEPTSTGRTRPATATVLERLHALDVLPELLSSSPFGRPDDSPIASLETLRHQQGRMSASKCGR